MKRIEQEYTKSTGLRQTKSEDEGIGKTRPHSPVALKATVPCGKFMGRDAVVIGTDGQDLHFTSVALADSPKVAGAYVRKGASQGEMRSQGFFYKPDGQDSGTLGLPISVPTQPGYGHLFETSAAILFLHNVGGHFSEIGDLYSNPEVAIDDACRASCIDWYGNARPLFVRDRIIALLGYELVEGSRQGEHIAEIRRVSFAPGRGQVATAASK